MNKLYVVFIVLLLNAFVVGCGSLVKPESEQKTTEQIKKSVVRIRAENREGTGFVVGVSDDKAYIVTVSHVVEGDPKPTVEFFENNKFEAEVLDNEAQENGLALLSVKGLIPYDVMPLYLVKKRNLKSGDALFTIGFPKGGARWAHDELSYYGKIRRNLIFSGSNEKEGNSGSPVIKEEDQVVAIITSITDYAYAISAESIRDFLEGAKGGRQVIDNMEKWKSSKWRITQEARLENAHIVIHEEARLKELELKIADAKEQLREVEAMFAVAKEAHRQNEQARLKELELKIADAKERYANAKEQLREAAAEKARRQVGVNPVPAEQTRKPAKEVAQATTSLKKTQQQRFKQANQKYYNVVRVPSNDVLNIRKKPDPNSKKVYTIPHDGQCILYLNESKEYKKSAWFKIQYNEREGWVNSHFLTKNNGNCSPPPKLRKNRS